MQIPNDGTRAVEKTKETELREQLPAMLISYLPGKKPFLPPPSLLPYKGAGGRVRNS
jgi:hypothetical protein